MIKVLQRLGKAGMLDFQREIGGSCLVLQDDNAIAANPWVTMMKQDSLTGARKCASNPRGIGP